ncbi:hypothetical protein J437_LFUL002155, partial [Ladona fulva]
MCVIPGGDPRKGRIKVVGTETSLYMIVFSVFHRNKYPVSPFGESGAGLREESQLGRGTPSGYSSGPLEEEEEDLPLLQMAVWAPRGNALCFVYRNDLYFRPFARRPKAYRLTNTGVPGVIFNAAYTQRARGNAGWVDAIEAPIFYPNEMGTEEEPPPFVARLPVRDGDAGTFRHVVLVESNVNGVVGGRKTTPLTHGIFEVVKILAWDAERHWIYYIAAPERRPGQRHLYRVGDLNGTSPRVNECLTCGPNDARRVTNWTEESGHHTVSQGPPPPCLFTNAIFSPRARYLVHECLGPDPPVVTLVDAGAIVATSSDAHVSLSSTDTLGGSSTPPTNAYEARVAILDTNDKLREHLSAMALPQVKTFQVEVENGYHAQVRLHLPPGLREYEEMTFPLVLQWGVDWGTYLASCRNFIYAQVDGRGSGFQGDRMLHEISRRLGSIEIVDQIAVITYLRDNLKFVDKEHVAVWGWSYGGFAAAMILAQDKSVFRCGISVAPVTSWAHYDSAYTERYMGLPNVTDNYRGYEEADMTKRAGNLRDKMFLLIHGTADDNVHYQQSMMLIKALTEEGVLFRHH